MKISTVLAVLFALVVGVQGFVIADAYSKLDWEKGQTESCRVHSKKALEEKEKGLKEHYGAQIVSRDQALDNLERQIWAERDQAVEAIVKAAEFRRDNPDVPQPKEGRTTVVLAEGKENFVFLFPAELKALQAIDAKHKQAIEYLLVLGRVTCKDEPSRAGWQEKVCRGSEAVGSRAVLQIIK